MCGRQSSLSRRPRLRCRRPRNTARLPQRFLLADLLPYRCFAIQKVCDRSRMCAIQHAWGAPTGGLCRALLGGVFSEHTGLSGLLVARERCGPGGFPSQRKGPGVARERPTASNVVPPSPVTPEHVKRDAWAGAYACRGPCPASQYAADAGAVQGVPASPRAWGGSASIALRVRRGALDGGGW